MSGAAQDNFNFFTVGTGERPFAAYDSSSDPTTLPPTYLVRGTKNVIKDYNNNIAVRVGLKRYGPLNAADNAIKSSYEWNTSFGQERPIWVLADGTMQVRFEDELITIDTTDFVDHTRVVFSPWWSDTTQQENLVMVNNTPNLYSWYGGMGRIASTSTSGGVSAITAAPASGGSSYDISSRFSPVLPGGSGAVFRAQSISGGVVDTINTTEYNPGYGYTPGTYTNVATTTVEGPGSGLIIASLTISELGTITFEDSSQYGGFISPTTTITSTPIVIDGTSYAYYGFIDEWTIYGLNSNSFTVGDIAYSPVVETANTPSADMNNDFIETINNQLVVGSYTSPTVYFSADTDFTDFTNAGDLVSGDPDTITLDELPRGLIVVNQSVYVPAGSGNWYICTPNTPLPYPQTLGTDDRLVIVKVDKKIGAARTAALAHEFIGALADTIVYLGQDHQLRMFGVFKDILGTKFPSVSIPVRQELIEEDFTGGELRTIEDDIYLVAPVSGKTYYYQQRDDVNDNGSIVSQRIWQPPQEWNISRLAIINDILYGYSNQSPEAYQLYNTNQWYDDTPAGIEPYECVARFAYWQFKDRTQLGDLDKLYIEGYMPQNTDLTSILRLNYLGSTATESVIVSAQDDSPVLYTETGILVGERLIGTELVGGSTGVSGLPKFRAIPKYKKRQCFEYQQELYSYALDARWEIICIGTNGTQVINKPVNLLKG